jgi:hypothetical protein
MRGRIVLILGGRISFVFFWGIAGYMPFPWLWHDAGCRHAVVV